MLEALKFPQKFVELIMICVTTPRFSFCINGALHGYLQSKRGLRQGDPMSPLHFVIGMEYLSRILTKIAKDSKFQFHPRCKSLALTHLCFADDLLLFCKGDYVSATLLLRAFKLFENSSGLKANIGKSVVYGTGMDTHSFERIVDISGFQKSLLPFKYLGMKICLKRLTRADCDCLVDKMTKRIKVWSSRNLSYAGRIVLINSVLLSINSFSSQIIILPKMVVQKINQVCRAFLWKSSEMLNGLGNVSWEVVCKTNKEGGLGFKDIGLWNLCAIGKHVWDITMKKDNLWVKWVNSVYIKNDDWWNHIAPNDASWYWKRIVQTKEIIKNLFTPIDFQSFNFSIQGLSNKMLSMQLERWKYSVIWDRSNVPKHRVIVWMALLGKLHTRDRLYRFGITPQADCLICGAAEENHSHLFFSCCFSRKILLEVASWCGIIYTVYYVWRGRNRVLWDHELPMVSVVVKNIIHVVCCKGVSCSEYKDF
ncbi:uncharacterized protein LOC133806538 [Humulus lupulus]|uniref:uncharacterized protein LOC133806538 n=1 Tax=Humulus lupulus TaxID=3486 RepID=UPI002B40AE48|nr:uncharacterized protein LOC133806538 [Humulus lupulus]